MANNKFAKFLAGVTVIGTGVAVGLTLFKKLDALNKELDEDEYEDHDFLSDFDEPDANDDNKEYVTINTVKSSDVITRLDNSDEDDIFEDDSDIDEPAVDDSDVNVSDADAADTANSDSTLAVALEAARDEAVEEFLMEAIDEELANESAYEVALDVIEDLDEAKGV